MIRPLDLVDAMVAEEQAAPLLARGRSAAFVTQAAERGRSGVLDVIVCVLRQVRQFFSSQQTAAAS